jgi:hypothetical protein
MSCCSQSARSTAKVISSKSTAVISMSSGEGVSSATSMSRDQVSAEMSLVGSRHSSPSGSSRRYCANFLH